MDRGKTNPLRVKFHRPGLMTLKWSRAAFPSIYRSKKPSSPVCRRCVPARDLLASVSILSNVHLYHFLAMFIDFL